MILTASLEKTYERPLHTVVIATVHLQLDEFNTELEQNMKEQTVKVLEVEPMKQGEWE